MAVKAQVCPDEPLGIGLWLSAQAARELRERASVDLFAQWLHARGLNVFTFNGFPYGDFHETVVKHRVYEPNWCEPARLDYTIDLIEILRAILPPGGEGSISTLPLGWSTSFETESARRRASVNLMRVAEYLAELEHKTGALIHVDLEPEPGCALDRSGDVVALFAEHLLTGDDDDIVRRHLRVCHDICHSAVMFEDQREAFDRYESIGVHVGKVQVSCAVSACLDDQTETEQNAAIEQLSSFHEPRYLHQTVARFADEPEDLFFEDLPDALAALRSLAEPKGQWRTHFHVPIFLDRIGALSTTQPEIATCLDLVRARPEIRHFEIETYAWDVLPAAAKRGSLASDIARELQWFKQQLALEQAT